MKEIEPLYFGDMRLDTLRDAIMGLILDRAAEQKIPVASVIGVLYIIQQELYGMMRDER